MAVFWNSFLEMMETLLVYVKSSRLGNWELHLHSMERMLKWFRAYNHTNYATRTSKKEEGHPLIYDEFQKGNFTVK